MPEEGNQNNQPQNVEEESPDGQEQIPMNAFSMMQGMQGGFDNDQLQQLLLRQILLQRQRMNDMAGSGGRMRMMRSWWDSDSDDEEYEEPKDRDDHRKRYRCGKDYVEMKDVLPWPEYYEQEKLDKPQPDQLKFKVNPEINKKVSLLRGDSTTLEVDAIVNAANSSLMGGGGIDGQIHRSAGRHLRKECAQYNGCRTGQSVITKGYDLPAKHVIHTVGPTDEVDDKALTSCYETVLDLVEKHKIKTIAFCCISTGIYGFPLRQATDIALNVTRKWLEKNDNYKKVDRIIFVTFKYDDKEEKVYQRYFPRYFPIEETSENADLHQEQPDTPPPTPKRRWFWGNWSDDDDNKDTSPVSYQISSDDDQQTYEMGGILDGDKEKDD